MNFEEIIRIITNVPTYVWVIAIVFVAWMIFLFKIENKNNYPSINLAENNLDKYLISRKKKDKIDYVLETSDKLHYLRKLNDSYIFNDNVEVEYEIDVILKSSQQYARFDFREKLKELFLKEPDKYKGIIEPILENKQKFEEYSLRINQLDNISSSRNHDGIDIETYKDIEEKIFNENIKKPIVDIAFFTYPVYRTGSGRETVHDMEVLWLKDIEEIIKEISDDKISKEQRQNERSLMSDSLRYDVLKRDNFRCTICGRTAADGIKLHVDHIMPIAKGGKTEMSNLRTLCNQCNVGKSDKWDDNGIN